MVFTNIDYFLIDSTDIGKYGAFSSIGSNADYDRRGYISTFQRDNNQVSEVKNSTVFLYTGGVTVDEDILFQQGNDRYPVLCLK